MENMTPDTNQGSFNQAHALAERLYDLQKDQADNMLALLKDHGTTLTNLSMDVAVIKEQTKEVPSLKDRIALLEQFKWKITGWVAAAFVLAWLAEHTPKLIEVFK